MSRLVVFGAGGRSGRMILTEARSRGHQVTAAVRNPHKHVDLKHEGATLVAADAMNHHDVRSAAVGHDVAVNATRSAGDIEPDYLVRLHHSLLTGLSHAGVPRLLIVGGAGTLQLASGVQFVDTPTFPDSARPRGLAHREALEALRTADTEIDWVYVTPPPNFVADGTRTGTYRIGRSQPPADERGNSTISYADYAIGITDEIESLTYHNERVVLAS